MMGFIILPLRGCHACLSLGLNKIGTHYEGRCSGISVLFANTIIVTVIFRIRVKLKVWVANSHACGHMTCGWPVLAYQAATGSWEVIY